MKYLKYRTDFLTNDIKLDNSKVLSQMRTSEMISETFENDITWGGSLLGRLINSTIRKGKIYAKSLRIDGIVKDVEKELLQLVALAAVGDEAAKKQILVIQTKFLIEEIYKVVKSKKAVDEKLTELVGDKSDTSGLIGTAITQIQAVDDKDLPKKAELVDKLKKFRVKLLEIDFEPKETEAEVESTSSVKDNFYGESKKLITAILTLNDIILNKKVSIETTQSGPQLKVGNEYLYGDKIVKLIDLEHPHRAGSDKQWLTPDDDIEKGKNIKPNVFVIWKDPVTNTYKSNAPSQSVDPDKLKEIKESLTSFYESESLPIFENTIIKADNKNLKNAWTKVLKSWQASSISKTLPRLQELSKKSENDDLSKKWILDIFKQVIDNKVTVGKPLTTEELIKEAALPNTYNDIPKAISLVSRTILAFKGDSKLISELGEAGKPINDFIESFGELEKLRVSLKSEKKGSEPKKESSVFRYSSFSLIKEQDEITPQTQGEDESQTEDTKDKVVEAWSSEFTEGEEKEWRVDEKKAKELQEKVEQIENKGVDIDADDNKDNIIRIVNLFGKAYKLYATSVIPSGRPGGRISQKTFREYTYIGSGSNEPTWQETSGPSGGPWAANIPFEKWQNGIMKILENTKYRKVLANVKFKNRGPNQKEGSGPTLFEFINEMLGDGGKGSDFRVKRYEILKKYFVGSSENLTKQTDPIVTGNQPVNPDDKGKKTDLSFEDYSRFGRNGRNFRVKKIIDDYQGEFFKIKVEEDRKINYFIGYFEGDINEKALVIKFQKSEGGKKQSIISDYLKTTIKNEKLKLVGIEEERNKKLFIGVIDKSVSDEIAIGQTLTMKQAEVTGSNLFGDVKDIEVKVLALNALGIFNPDTNKWETTKAESPEGRLPKDVKIDNIKAKKTDFGL